LAHVSHYTNNIFRESLRDNAIEIISEVRNPYEFILIVHCTPYIYYLQDHTGDNVLCQFFLGFNVCTNAMLDGFYFGKIIKRIKMPTVYLHHFSMKRIEYKG
jgi:hypothetical protein